MVPGNGAIDVRCCDRRTCALVGRLTRQRRCPGCGFLTRPVVVSASAVAGDGYEVAAQGGREGHVNAPLLSVTYTGEPDVIFEYRSEGESRHFGRDEQRCEIVVWSAINGRDLSRVAGSIWRMGEELWLRNLSTRHDLHIEVPGRPPEPALPPRLDDGIDRGPARTIPGPLAILRAPDGCELLVRQERDTAGGPLAASTLEETVRLPPIPGDLRAVAIALCEPLLRGGQLPASYAQIAERTSTASQKKTRTDIARLCNLYAAAVPALRTRIAQRMDRDLAALNVAADSRLRGGIWVFDPVPETDSDAESARRRALALPDYFEVAHLLVRRRLVTTDDIEPDPPRRPS